MMRSISWLVAAGLCCVVVNAQAAEKKCSLQRYADLPVTMVGTRPLINGTINGKPARFLADSGAFFSMLSNRSAEKHGLRVGLPPVNIRVRGTGGSTAVSYTKVKEFSLVGYANGRTLEDVEFLVDEATFGYDVDGIIGQNVIGIADTEYDLANGALRIFRAKDCDQSLAYWARNMPVAQMKIVKARTSLHFLGDAKLNGKKIRVLFDTGAWRSLLTLDAAARAGIEPEDDGVVAGGVSRGIGKKTTENSIARFDSLDIGGEVIKNARLRIGDISLEKADMLLGADFFLSHRVYISAAQGKIYFTYNGGPVFDLRANNNEPKVAPDVQTATAQPDSSTPALSAEELRRRGAASMARQDYDAALADLDKAVELEPENVENLHQRGLARWANRRPLLAMQDFDAVLKLQPDHTDALLARGMMRLRGGNDSGATADFQEALRIAPKDPGIAYRVVDAYQSAGKWEASIERLNALITDFPKEERLSTALTARCRSRAMLGRELELARDDCNAAIKKGPRNSIVFDTRGLVWLQLGKFDEAIDDYQAALRLQPKFAPALYGLGLAESKKGLSESSKSNMKAAVELDPEVATAFRRLGLAQ